MPQSSSPGVGSWTWVGVCFALFGMLIVRWAVAFVWPTLTIAATVCRESLYWICAILLLILIRRCERLPLSSVGIGTQPFKRSTAWAALLALACLVIGFAIALATHFNGGSSGEALSRLPTWLLLLIVLRAGAVEELFYRGYAIERLRALGLNTSVAVAIPLLVFSVAHWRGGWANIVIALALGIILSISYLWRRDLVANMLGHFAVDFISIVLPRLVHHS